MAGSDFNYKFGTKNNWRRWAWNRIAELIPEKRDAICAYLPSSKDEDRAIALSRGFRNENLIGIERNKKSAITVRKAGALCVHGDFFSSVSAIINNKKLSVIFGDFCSGLDSTKITNHVICWMGHENCRSAVFAFNFLRGRDSGSNDLRGSIKEAHAYMHEHMGRSLDDLRSLSMHRGMVFFQFLGIEVYEKWKGESAENSLDDFRKFSRTFIDLSGFKTNSYKSSSGQMFDSVVFRNPIPKMFPHGYFDSQSDLSKLLLNNADIKSKRSVAAILAHRTMRADGVGSYA